MKYTFQQRLFTKYSDLDDEVIKLASKLDFYLIGGTALEIWMNYYHLKFHRNRSNNDLDFTCSPLTEVKNINKLTSEIKKLGINLEVDSIGFYKFSNDLISVDILTDDERLIAKHKTVIECIKIMDPTYLISTKQSRYNKIKSDPKMKDRAQKDLLDLKDLDKVNTAYLMSLI